MKTSVLEIAAGIILAKIICELFNLLLSMAY